MAKREQLPPLLKLDSDVQTLLSRCPDGQRLSARKRETLNSMFAVIALKATIGSSAQSYVSGVGYIAPREERNLFSCRDISPCLLFVPIRDDPEMVVNLGLRDAEAGLRRWGVAA